MSEPTVIILGKNDMRREQIEKLIEGRSDIVLVESKPISVPFDFDAPVDRRPRNRKERRQGRIY